MALLGENLRREREARGITLEAIASQTRIGIRFLKAIEESAFEQLPGGIFNKNFVRQYARFLGVDEEAAVREYVQAADIPREAELSASAPPAPPPFTLGRLLLAGSALALLIAVVAGVWYLLPRSDSPLKQSPASGAATSDPAASESTAAGAMARSSENSIPSPPATGPALEGAPAVEAAGTAPQAAPQGSQSAGVEALQTVGVNAPALMVPRPSEVIIAEAPPNDAAAGSNPVEELLLQISARSAVWLSITADGESSWQGTLQPNQSRAVQATESIRLTVGNAGGVDLTLNGKEIAALGREGEVKTVTLASQNLREPVPQQ